MRKWEKRFLIRGENKILKEIDGASYYKFSKQMNFYKADKNAYLSIESFFKKYLIDRYIAYRDFILQSLPISILKNGRILSIASGRGINELDLIYNHNAQILLTDLEIPNCLPIQKKLFGEFEYKKLDILKTLNDYEEGSFDAIISVSLIYAFDEKELNIFFKNISYLLKKDGVFILDSSGSPDNFLAYFIHNIYLPIECGIVFGISKIFNLKRSYVIDKNYGYRRNDKEILDVSKAHKLMLVNQKNYMETVDFERSLVVLKLLEIFPNFKNFLKILGAHVPYTRMFKLIKQ